MFQVSTLHTSQLRLSPPRNLIINPLSRLWDKLLPDQIGINRRISGEVVVEVSRPGFTRSHTASARCGGNRRHWTPGRMCPVVSGQVSPCHRVLGSRVSSSRDSWPSSSQVPGHTATADAAQVVEGGGVR